MAAPKGNQNAVGNKGGGALTLYKPKMAKQAKMAMRAGYTLVEIGELLGVCEKTIDTWKNTHVEFATALETGRRDADLEVVNSLYYRAKGYSHPAVKIFMTKEGDIVEAPYTEHFPPDTKAAMYWLGNRDPKRWKDRRVEDDANAPTGDTHYHVHVTIPQAAEGQDTSYRNVQSRPRVIENVKEE